MTVDRKQQWQAARLHGAIVDGEFDENTVLMLMLLLREHAPKNSVVREFGDFVAHRDKDRGPIHTYVMSAITALERQARGLPGPVRIAPVHTVRELGASLAHVLSLFSCAPLVDDRVNQVATCLISLLQEVTLTKKNNPTAHLKVGGRPGQIELQGTGPLVAQGKNVTVVFQAFIAENREYFPYPGHPFTFKGVSWAECRAGSFRILER